MGIQNKKNKKNKKNPWMETDSALTAVESVHAALLVFKLESERVAEAQRGVRKLSSISDF